MRQLPLVDARRTFSLHVPSHSQGATDCPVCTLRCMLTTHSRPPVCDTTLAGEEALTRDGGERVSGTYVLVGCLGPSSPSPAHVDPCVLHSQRHRCPFFVFCAPTSCRLPTRLECHRPSTSTVTRFRTTCAMVHRECCRSRLILTLPSRLLVHDCGGRRWDAGRK